MSQTLHGETTPGRGHPVAEVIRDHHSRLGDQGRGTQDETTKDMGQQRRTQDPEQTSLLDDASWTRHALLLHNLNGKR